MSNVIQCKNYNIYIDQWESLTKSIDNEYSKKIILVDENTEKYCLPIFLENIKTTFDVICIPQGEEYKNLQTAQYIWSEMLRLNADRHSICINLGGGVIGDIGGWAASSYMRGMDFIQVPTTLLSMVDASVGGKLGIDFQGVKNIIGLIKDPNGVFIFPEFLRTLSDRLVKSGYAEILKHGLISDRSYWNRIKNINPETNTDWKNIIFESVKIKRSVTETDPKERGLRKILNFGHTIGHAIESLSFRSKKPLLHGEAIGIGMITEAHLGYQKGYLPQSDLDETVETINTVYGDLSDYIPHLQDLEDLMKMDKKNKSGKIKFSLLKEIGKAVYDIEADSKMIQNSLNFYKSTQ